MKTVPVIDVRVCDPELLKKLGCRVVGPVGEPTISNDAITLWEDQATSEMGTVGFSTLEIKVNPNGVYTKMEDHERTPEFLGDFTEDVILPIAPAGELNPEEIVGLYLPVGFGLFMDERDFHFLPTAKSVPCVGRVIARPHISGDCPTVDVEFQLERTF